MLFSTDMELDLEKVSEAISMLSGFEGIEIRTIKEIIEKEVNIGGSSNM